MKETGNIYFEEAILPSFGAENRYLPNEEEELKPVFSLNTNDDGIIVNLRYLVDYRDGTKVKTGLQRKFLTKFEKTQKLILHP